MQSRGTVVIVDHDPNLLESLERLLRLHSYWVKTFLSVKSFLTFPLPNGPCCAIIDAEMPGITGRELHRLASTRRPDLPIVQLTQHGSIPQAVQAIRDGAVDFLTKPVEENALIYAVQRAFVEEERLRPEREQRALFEKRFATLTQREKEVCAHVISGKLNKQIAFELGTCEKTVKVHRGRVMRKLSVESVAELVRFAVIATHNTAAGGQDPGDDHNSLDAATNRHAMPEANAGRYHGASAHFPLVQYTRATAPM